jgi:hypothetical protein
MARYAILNTVDWEGCRSLGQGEVTDEQVMENLTGCVWLFRVDDGVESVEEAAREAAQAFLASEAGRTLLGREEVSHPSWTDVVRWLSDAEWARVGMQPIRHPDVERVILDAAEVLADTAAQAG